MRAKSRPNIGVILVGLVLTLTLSLVVSQGHAAIPQQINYQGYLTNASGVPINGTLQMTFAIYDALTGGTALWTETQNNVPVTHGVYNITLGSQIAIVLAFDVPYFLEIEIGGEVLSPRKAITSVGYAFRAGVADQAQNADISNFANTAISSETAGIFTGPLGGDVIGNQVGTIVTRIQGRPVLPDSPSANQVLRYNGTDWAPSLIFLDTDTIGVLPISKGGTGSDIKNFIDLSTDQTIGGTKTFNNPIASNVSTGTPPMQVISTTMVANLNSEMVSGKKLADLDNRYGVMTAPSRVSRTNIINTLTGNPYMDCYFTSITIGTDGFPVISFYDGPTWSLRVAKCNDASCSSTAINILDSGGDVGHYTSITIGTDGFPVISYYDSTNGNLKVAKCGDALCTHAYVTLITIDSTGIVGATSSIIIGADGFPVISYWDSTNGNLKVAKCGDSSCTPASVMLNTIDSAGDVGVYSSITIGTDGFPVISYYDSTNRDLKVAKCGNPSCTPASVTLNTIDSAGDVGHYTSITIGTDGFPVISYYDSTNSDLKVAKCGNPSCVPASVTLNTIDSAGDVGEYTSITIGTDGFPVISYKDWNGPLKVVKCANSFCLNNWWRR